MKIPFNRTDDTVRSRAADLSGKEPFMRVGDTSAAYAAIRAREDAHVREHRPDPTRRELFATFGKAQADAAAMQQARLAALRT